VIPLGLCLALGACSTSAPPGASPDASAAVDGATLSSADGGGPLPIDDGPLLNNPSTHNTVVGRPTDRSVAVSVLAAGPGDSVRVEYATAITTDRAGLVGAMTTAAATSASGEPMVVELTGLAPDTKYYYRVLYTPPGGSATPDSLHSVRTQRAPGRTFHFGVQGDTHPERSGKMFHRDLFTLTMQEVARRQPDLYFTLGDDFSIEKIIQVWKDQNYGAGHSFTRAVEGVAPYSVYQALPKLFVQAMITDGVSAPQSNAAYREMREKYFGLMAAATPLFLTNGNHEQAHLANVGGVFNNAAIWAADGRLKYYPLPAPGGFYTGDATPLAAQNGYPTVAATDGLLRDYYAFTWGDALFVTLDPYWHSPTVSPDSTLFADPEPYWGPTLGDAQYAWLKQTLESSTAKWKFVFAHHINGNNRGAAGVVGVQEWGGETGSRGSFATNRPTWPKSIHQLFVDTHVTVFFQGHDHLFAREIVDGVVYQEVPNPGDHSYYPYNCDAYAPTTIPWTGPSGYGKYESTSAVWLPDTGFLDVTVAPDHVQVDYVRTYRDVDLQSNLNGSFKGTEKSGEVAFTYSVPSRTTDTDPASVRTPCPGAAPPGTWKYNP
jgi:hypothetical protein